MGRCRVHVRLKRGLDIKIAGAPVQAVGDAAPIASVALLGADCTGVRPAFRVEVGDHVAAGQTVFVDRRRPEIAFTAPGSGTVTAIDRSPHGFEALVIELDGNDSETFEPPTRKGTRDAVRSLLLKAGLWPAFLTRPFGRIPDPNAIPDAIFVTAMDTNPLAADARAGVRLSGDRARACRRRQ
jgi:Na+-transporting NADH:ubiquinone oxidoreductase subunit A